MVQKKQQGKIVKNKWSRILELGKKKWCGTVCCIGNDTEKVSWEGLLTVADNPTIRINRPWMFKAVPPLVQKL